MKKLKVFAMLVLLAGAAAGLHYRLPVVIALVGSVVALFSLVGGIQMIITRRAAIPTSDSLDPHREYYSGLPAQLWGVLFVLFSLVMGAFALYYWIYGSAPSDDLLRRLLATRWIFSAVIIGAGATLGVFGLTRLLAGNAAFRETKLKPFERVLGGVWACTLGALIIGAGVVHLIAPGALTAWRDGAIAWVLELAR